MFLMKDKVSNVLNDYLQRVMIPKSPSSTHSFLSGIAVGFGIRKINAMLTDPKMVDTLITLGVMDATGRVNLEELRKIVDDAIKVSGAINIPVINYNLDSSDFNSIFEIAKQYSIGDTNGTSTNCDMQRSSF